MRILWLITGLFALLLGLLGVFLPILPTVPFMIMAAFCFSKSSRRLHDWLVFHPVYGQHIRDWREHGAIHSNAKRLATVMIAGAFGLSLMVGVRPTILWIQAGVLSLVLMFIWTRPSR